MRRPGIHGWIGGRYGSPTEYGLPLDDSYLYENEEEEPDPEPQPCACAGEGWIGCACQEAEDGPDLGDLVEILFEINRAGDDWTPVKIGAHDREHCPKQGVPAGTQSHN
jgi:hypothetical protein